MLAVQSADSIGVRSSPDGSSRLRPWRIVALLWLAFLLNYIDRQAVFSIYPSLRHELHFTNLQLGLIGSIFLWVYSLSSVLTGRLVDIFNKSSLIIVCLAIWSVATLATGLSHSIHTFLFWRGVMGLSESLYLPASMALIAIVHSETSRSSALAAHQTAQMAGIILGGWLGGWMADHFGWRSSFALLAAVGITYMPLLWVGLRKAPGLRIAKVEKPRDWSRVFQSRCYIALAAAFTAYCLMLWIFYAWFPAYVYEHFHLSQTQSGLTATLYPQASMAVGVLFWGFVADRMRRNARMARFLVLGTGVIGCAPFAYLALSVDSLYWLKIACFGFGFFAGALHSNISASAFDVIRAQNYGIAVGILNLVGGLGGGAAVLVTGIYRERLGIANLMGCSSVMAMTAAICMLLVVRRYFAREHEAVAGLA